MSDKEFVQTIYTYYKERGRHDLPWRMPALTPRKDGSLDPYKILVSEIMLQQTQVDRVIPKYKTFLKKFPTAKALAKATLSEVLEAWSGLGYNRRARFLKLATQEIVSNRKNKFPRMRAELDALPGIGEYTAGAICAFAFNVPEIFLETNIRAVYLHFFFPKKKAVHDKELLPVLARTIDKRHPRKWYAALMDYGTKLKSEIVNPTRRSKIYAKQAVFKGSVRETRGKILKKLLKEKKISMQDMALMDKKNSSKAREGLIRDGLIEKVGAWYKLTN